MDLEMTGLDPQTCAIVQMAIVLTDPDLQAIDEPLDLTIWQPESVLERMSPFVREMHERSGLLDAVRRSSVSVFEAERAGMELVARHAPFGTARLCGNSIWQDRRFLCQHMPTLESYLHYRMLDVSSVKQLAQWWYDAEHVKPDVGRHTALVDVRASIAELAAYREKIFRGTD
jgi:oligoribonuclease